jgi:hypothetical protein
LAIALLRATAPAFTAPLVAVYEADEAEEVGNASEAEREREAASDAEQAELPVSAAPELRLEELPGVALGVVIVLAGVAPGVALTLASGAAGATMQAGALDGLVASSSSGYTAGVGEWFVTAPVIFVVVGAVALAWVRSRTSREIRPIYLAGQTPDAVAAGVNDANEANDSDDGEQAAELVALPEPTEAWGDLRGALRSGWLTPGAAWLGLDHEDAESAADADDVEDAEDAEDAGDDTDATGAADGALTPEATGASATARTPDGAGGQA